MLSSVIQVSPPEGITDGLDTGMFQKPFENQGRAREEW